MTLEELERIEKAALIAIVDGVLYVNITLYPADLLLLVRVWREANRKAVLEEAREGVPK